MRAEHHGGLIPQGGWQLVGKVTLRLSARELEILGYLPVLVTDANLLLEKPELVLHTRVYVPRLIIHDVILRPVNGADDEAVLG